MAVHFTTKGIIYHVSLPQPMKYTESLIFAIFVLVLMTLCILGLKVLKLFCTFMSAVKVFVHWELWTKVPVTIIFLTVDSKNLVVQCTYQGNIPSCLFSQLWDVPFHRKPIRNITVWQISYLLHIGYHQYQNVL